MSKKQADYFAWTAPLIGMAWFVIASPFKAFSASPPKNPSVAFQRWVGALVLALLPALLVSWPNPLARFGACVVAALAGLALARRRLVAAGVDVSAVRFGDGLCPLGTRRGAITAVVGVTASIALCFTPFPWLGAYAFAAATFAIVDFAVREAAERARTIARYTEACVAAFGVSANELEGRLWPTRDGGVRISPAPAKARIRLQDEPDKVDSALDASLSEDVEAVRDGESIVVIPATKETVARRKWLERSGGMVSGVSRKTADGKRILTLTSKAMPADVDAFAQEHMNGGSLLDFEGRRAVIGFLSDDDRALRLRFAQGIIGAQAVGHEVALDVERGDDGITQLVVAKAPITKARDGGTVEAEYKRILLKSVKEAHVDWTVDVDPLTDRVTMTRRPKRVLPKLVPLEEVLADHLDPDDWANIAFGVGPEGVVAVNLKTGPHSLYQGPTGSGKTIALCAQGASAMTRGHDLVVIDPVKKAADYLPLEPYTRGFAKTYEDASALIKAVYQEGMRRQLVLDKHRISGGWTKLPKDIRDEEDIRPLTVIIDEYESLRTEEKTFKSLPKDHPDNVEAETTNRHKVMVDATTQRTARELRSVGIFLIIATQDANADSLGGRPFRKNLSSATNQFMPGKVVDPFSLAFMFDKAAAVAADEASRFDDGKSLGLAVTMAGETGRPTAVRVGYAEGNDIPALLEARGVRPVPDSRRFSLDADDEEPGDTAAARGVEPPAAPWE